MKAYKDENGTYRTLDGIKIVPCYSLKRGEHVIMTNIDDLELVKMSEL